MKAKKMRISKNKRNNIKRNTLARQGKLKGKRHKKQSLVKSAQKPVPIKKPEVVEEEHDVMDMLDDEELDYIRKTAGKQKLDDSNLEMQYEKSISDRINQNGEAKEVRFMLPIKTRDGKVQAQMIEKPIEDEEEPVDENLSKKAQKKKDKVEEEIAVKPLEVQEEPVSMAKLIATREQNLQTRKFQIGILCSNVLENPDLNIKKLELVIKHLSDDNPETYITVRKLAMASLLEVFKDILPSYPILEIKQDGVILKQSTLKLQNFEATLLKYYKKYLQCLEKNAKLLRKSYPSTEMEKREAESKVAILAIKCMCEMLVSHPYFNFSKNIIQLLIPLLDCKQKEVRETVCKYVGQVFKEDIRAELSLQIVRGLNKYIKQRKHCVHPEILQVLLSLRIKDVDLEKEKEEETKKKKLEAKKKRIVNLSKKERKRKKNLQEVEKEMLEVQAEENKQTKQTNLTEITNVLFTIYFRILKQSPGTKVLSVCLEGLAKFTHCINIEYYQDLVNCLNSLMETDNLGLRERLHCISTVFTILSGHGSSLNIDPRRFYSYLYRDLFTFAQTKNTNDVRLLINILMQALVNRHKNLEQSRLLGFMKRISTLSLNLPHHGTLSILGVVRKFMQLGNRSRVLLDTENVGDGVYLPEIDEPEYCNAHCTSLWELAALQRHYHSTVRSVATNIACEVPTSGIGSLPGDISKLSPEDLYTEYDPSLVSFKPAIPPPKKRKIETSAVKKESV